MGKKKCKTCIYGCSLGGDWGCDYIGIVGHRRPCKAENCTEYKKIDGDGRKKSYMPLVSERSAPYARRGKMDVLHDKAMKLYREGKNDREMAAVLGVNRGSIQSWRERNKLPPNQSKGWVSTVDYDMVKKLYEAGLTDSEIARRISCNQCTISAWRRKYGLKSNWTEDKPKKPSVDVSSDEFGEMMNWAVRYSLGRKTYAVSDTVSFVLPLVQWLTDKTLWCIQDDIRQAERREGLGDKDIDAPKWLNLLDAVTKEIDRRGGYEK